jgi:hypothetical protein
MVDGSTQVATQGVAQGSAGTTSIEPGTEIGPGALSSATRASLLHSILRVATATTLGALAISLVVHLLGGVLAAIFVVGAVPGRGGGDGDGAPIEMAVISQGELTQLQDAAMGVATPSVTDVAMASEVPAATDTMSEGGDALGGDLGEVGTLAGGGDIAGTGEGLGGAGGGGGASFFGVEVQGNRFAYIVDVSGSMDGPRLGGLREELNESLSGLLETSEFVVIQFSDDAKIVGDTKTWQEASTAVKRSMRTQVGLLAATGGTNPVPGFEIVFQLRPRPDAIYFMTDGDFADQSADEILSLWSGSKIPVHTICFSSRDGEERMKRIAKHTRGSYTFVKGP